MQSELKSLSKIFAETIFRIPDYQRGYSWQDKHLKEFWNDIQQLPEGKSHYTGVLTLEPVGIEDYRKWEDDTWIIESKKYAPIYVVDGQQRLTTAIILLQAILEVIPDDAVLNFTNKAEIRKKYLFESKDQGISRSYIFGYEKDNPSSEFLKRTIYCESSENHAVPEATIYTSNLLKAKGFFLQELKSLSLLEIEKLYTKITQNLHFNIFYIEPELDVFVTFETMNNRGKPLSHLELLKNRLIYLSTRFDNEDKTERERLRKKINESWKTIYHFLGRKQSRLLNDDVFLLTHFLTYFGPTLPKLDPDDPDNSDYDIRRYLRHDELYKSILLEDIFNIRRIYKPNGTRLTLAEVDNYAQDIKSCVEVYYQLFDPEVMQVGDEEKIVLQQLNRVSGFDLKLLTLIATQTVKDDQKRIALFRLAERFAFVSRIQPNIIREMELDQLSIKLKANKLTVEESLRQIEAGSKRLIESAEFTEALRTIGKVNGYYGWTGLRYFMYEYEQMLRAKSKTSRQLVTWDDFQAEIFESDHKSIEHIYPQRPTDPYWKDRFTKYVPSERNLLRNSVGNLLPASLGKNSSLSNKAFPEKCGSTENQVGYRYGNLSEIQVSQQQEWTAIQIAARGLALLDFMETRWNIPLGSDDKKLEILGLTFILNREGIDIKRLRDSYKTVLPRKAVAQQKTVSKN